MEGGAVGRHLLERSDAVKSLCAPLQESDIRQLKAGEDIAISGIIYAARDMAHKRLCAVLERGLELPIDLNGAIIYYVGPTPARAQMAVGAAGPTTAARMDPFSPALFAQGVRATIGKGYRSAEVRRSLREHGAVHLSTLGGAGALLSKHIVGAEIVAYGDLGTEAIRRLEVVDFPAVVAYDAAGDSVYDKIGCVTGD